MHWFNRDDLYPTHLWFNYSCVQKSMEKPNSSTCSEVLTPEFKTLDQKSSSMFLSMSGECLGYAWGNAWGMHEGMPGVCPGYARGMPGVCPGYAWGLGQTTYNQVNSLV